MTYEQIISEKETVIKVLQECYFSADEPVKKWEDAREFISKVISTPGTILDIGCANGFLLKSLQSWTGQELIPYGIDHYKRNISNARKLFPEFKENFLTISFEDFMKVYPQDFPKTFDYIYWSFWYNNHIISIEEINMLLLHVNRHGKLIIGFYPNNSKEPTDEIGNIPRLKSLLANTINIKNDVSGRSEQILVIKK